MNPKAGGDALRSMKRPSVASLKRVTADNLVRLGADRLAEILLEVAETRVELKRRLRMELAAEQGAEHLLPEIDRRLSLLASSRGAVSWRQRPAFIRDLDGLRGLIASRLAALDRAAAQDRILTFLALASRSARRVRDKEGAVDAVFIRAAADAVSLHADDPEAVARLASAIREQPANWSRWAETAFAETPLAIAQALIGLTRDARGPAWGGLLRRLADLAGDAAAYRDSFTADALALPAVAAGVAARFLRAGQAEEARHALEEALTPTLVRRGAHGAAPDFAWETVWIDYLEAAGRKAEAQAARWASFERTMSTERAREHLKRLPDFDDVEGEQKAFDAAANFPDAEAALAFLMAWPALREAAAFIAARGRELSPKAEVAEGWARKLRTRHPAAAEALLRRGAAEAFRQRAFHVANRLTEEADAIST